MSTDSQAEGEPIPSYLYQMRNSWSVDRTLGSLGLDTEDANDQGNRQFILTTNIVQNLWDNFGKAAEHQAGGSVLKSGLEGALWPGMPENSDLQPVIGDLYGKAECLTGANFEILTDGFGEHSTWPSWLKFEVGRMIESYGLKVEEDDMVQDIPQGQRSLVHPGVEADSGSPQEMFEGTARRLNIPEDKWRDPTYYQLIGLLVGLDKVIIESKKGLSKTTTLTPNSGPSVQNRYHTTIQLMTGMKGIMESELKGEKVSTAFLKETIGEGLSVYGLKVVDNETQESPRKPDE